MSGGKGRKKYIAPSISRELAPPIAPISRKNEYKKIHTPIAMTKIPLITE